MLAGVVVVDGEVVTRLGTKVDPRTAVIRVEGKRLPPVSAHVYLALNKPRGVVSTMSDPEGRRTLQDLVDDRPELVFHEGRNRIVRRLLDHVGHPVRRLTRTAIGPVQLQGLGTGELRDLTLPELGELLDSAK